MGTGQLLTLVTSASPLFPEVTPKTSFHPTVQLPQNMTHLCDVKIGLPAQHVPAKLLHNDLNAASSNTTGNLSDLVLEPFNGFYTDTSIYLPPEGKPQKLSPPRAINRILSLVHR